MTTLEVEIALMRKLNIRQNLIVCGISEMSGILDFETDLLSITNSGYATGVEIKVSKPDLRKDLDKPHIKSYDTLFYGKTGKEKYFSKFKYFYYAVPEKLVEETLKQVHSDFGVFGLYEKGNRIHVKEVRKPKFLFNYKFETEEKLKVARLGAMRVYNLKVKENDSRRNSFKK